MKGNFYCRKWAAARQNELCKNQCKKCKVIVVNRQEETKDIIAGIKTGRLHL